MKKPTNPIEHGFTLIELMITIVIIGILAAVAIPSYQTYIIKSNRSAAQAEMMDIAIRQQQFLLANRSYASKTTLEGSGYSLPSSLTSRYTYSIDIGTGAVPTFTITFTGIGAQVSDGNLTLNEQGIKTPNAKW